MSGGVTGGPFATSITWTRPKLRRFKVAQQAAEKRLATAFCWEGYDFDTRYAKYLIEWLEGELGG